MDKLEWHHLIHVAHFTGLFLLLALPVSSVLLWLYGPSDDQEVNLKFTQLLGRLDRTTQVGILILIISGIAQIWAHDIGPGEIYGDQVWLGIKIVLVIVLVVTGILVSGPAIRARKNLLQQIVARGREPSPRRRWHFARVTS